MVTNRASANDDLNEAAANIVENLASRVAQAAGGTITVNHLMPYLPMSFALIRQALDNMVDGTTVVSQTDRGWTTYTFTKHAGKTADAALRTDTCVACECELPKRRSHEAVCGRCIGVLREELNRLAGLTLWPAQALYQHEILCVAANQPAPLDAETLASHSSFTLKRIAPKLDRMTADGIIGQRLDEATGTLEYVLPEIRYSREQFGRNLSVIRSYPSSSEEEFEVKLIRIVTILALILVLFVVLGFFLVPFPLLVVAFVIVAPIVSVSVWRRKLPAPDR